MKLVLQYKWSFGIILCVIFISIFALNIIQGFVTFELHWKPWSLLSQPSKTNKSVKWINIQKKTKEHTSTADRNLCTDKRNSSTWFQTNHGRLLLNKTLYYCAIPKCGSTFMGSFLHNLFSNKVGNNSFMFHIKRNVNISNVYSFMFVRDPYSRLFSAYENKLFNPNSFFEKLGTDIIREVRKNASELSLHLGHDVTFTELIKYIIKFYEHGRILNPHIAAMHTLCHPCQQKYDFIGKLETMTTDLVLLAKEWRRRGIISDEANTTEDVESDTKDQGLYGPIGHMFSFHLRAKDLISKYKLFHRTWASYQMRGLILKDYKMPFTRSSSKRASYSSYTKAVKTAIDVSKTYKDKLKAQRKEALYQAYETLPGEIVEKLRQYVKTDCELFGYENRPSWIFNQSDLRSFNEHNYFEWL